jgi:hypothetical protein
MHDPTDGSWFDDVPVLGHAIDDLADVFHDVRSFLVGRLPGVGLPELEGLHDVFHVGEGTEHHWGEHHGPLHLNDRDVDLGPGHAASIVADHGLAPGHVVGAGAESDHIGPATASWSAAFAVLDAPSSMAAFPDGRFDPDHRDVDVSLDHGVHGHPMADAIYHQAQASHNDCLPTSAAMVATEILGVHVPQSEIVALAVERGLLGDGGVTLEGGAQLLEHFGLRAEVQTGSMDSLRGLLDADKQIIIGLDADDLHGDGDRPFHDELVMGHAVVITGIDDDAGLVYLNDPGLSDGAGVSISIADFADAWRDGHNAMVVVDAPDDPTFVAGAEHAVPADLGDLSLVDLILLPLRLAPDR